MGENYLNKESVNLYSSVFNSLSGVFGNVIPLSGNKLYFIASDGELSPDICRLDSLRGITNTYVSPDYLSDDLIKLKTEEILNTIDRDIRENRALFPVASFHLQAYNFSKDLDEKMPSLILMIAAFAIPVFSVRRRNLVMYFSSSALAGFEMILLFSLQLTAGNMYQFTGIILAAIMAGLAGGSACNCGVMKKFSVKIKSLLLIVFYFLSAIVFSRITSIFSMTEVLFIIFISSLIPSFLTGNIFRDLTMADTGGLTASEVYSADLAGSALGFIIITGVAVPLLGIRLSIFFLALMILTGIMFGAKSDKM
jgi:hypothetical protein